MTIDDRYGLPVTTSSHVALERFQEGMDRLLSFGPGADEGFAAAVEADPGLAVAHAGSALMAVAQGLSLYTSPSPRDYAASRMPSSA
jgi:hypothetical protein